MSTLPTLSKARRYTALRDTADLRQHCRDDLPSSGEGLQETRLKQDVYYLEKPRRKTEALIFGSHDNSTLEMTQRMSTYLDTLWGAENVPWSMYYLNGQDNSLVLISTLPLKDLTSGFKESTVSDIVDSRRAEMLQQANALDERESFLTCAAALAERSLLYLAYHVQPAGTSGNGRGF